MEIICLKLRIKSKCFVLASRALYNLVSPELPHLSQSSHTGLIVLLERLKPIPASGPLPLLFPMPGMHFPEIVIWLLYLISGSIHMLPLQKTPML